ncbi:unnamed protein product [Aphanomyces euteiches]|uniref:Uncharacterized protein n=1 Tax=Aphanomyces euteiches TaxID=100861 RepID=A0A6G0WID2_9STRA|nr:hypothetical protein Ae201684_014958 [Aphanomyces euteiches]KAG9411072.1 hypothetical protein AC1031_016719 [Aphanomyces cochlioides]KAH9076827.1 hypothetical protein Ae201684P_010758 [Aphanomyces euteiches]KAH9109949.1 hypothetical protein AeMF1_015104 [Aphanomyces euteiches]KAH9151250.1 hypothetical protein AeRB84_006099 [Aphanomyces euteiches]
MVDTSSVGVLSFPFTLPRISVPPPPSPSHAIAEVLEIMTRAIQDAQAALARHMSEQTSEDDVVDDICAFRKQCQQANAIMATAMVTRRLVQSPVLYDDDDDVQLAAFYRDMQAHFKQADDIEMRFECLPSRMNRDDSTSDELRLPVYPSDQVHYECS